MTRPIYKSLYVQVLTGIALGVIFGSSPRPSAARDETARRRLHQAREDADRADRVHDGRRRHRAHGRDEGRRPHRHPRARLFRGRLDASRSSSASSSSTSCSRARDSASIRRPPTLELGVGIHHRRRSISARSISCSTSSPTPSSARSRAARSCRSCSSRCCSAWRCCRLGRASRRWSSPRSTVTDALFDVVGMIMRLAPIGAFGAMAFTVGRYGIGIAARRSAS